MGYAVSRNSSRITLRWVVAITSLQALVVRRQPLPSCPDCCHSSRTRAKHTAGESAKSVVDVVDFGDYNGLWVIVLVSPLSDCAPLSTKSTQSTIKSENGSFELGQPRMHPIPRPPTPPRLCQSLPTATQHTATLHLQCLHPLSPLDVTAHAKCLRG